MRYLSQLFQPFLTIPKNAKIKSTEITCTSQKLLVECGLMRPASTGFFTLLPLARRALDKLENIVRHSIESVGGQRMSLPTLTSSNLWEKSGRLEMCQSELLMLEDRLQKKYVLAPTHEEAIADLLSDISPLSYRQMPLLLYQISDKYRDEQRPKHGLLRARQFLMMDAYGAHEDMENATHMYERITEAYVNLFQRLKLDVHKVEAPSGEMGGSLSHEWHLKADAGEDVVTLCKSCQTFDVVVQNDRCRVCSGSVDQFNSIEVGHTFLLGTKYTDALNATYTNKEGTNQPILMSCYGIGLSRLLAASIEGSSDKIKWPTCIAPYSVILIGPKEGSKEWASGGWEKVLHLSHELTQVPRLANDVVIDDRHHMTIGKRLLQAEKTGYPLVVVCGVACTNTPAQYEVRTNGTIKNMLLQELIDFINKVIE